VFSNSEEIATPSNTSTPVRSYGFGTTVDLPYEQAVERIRVALKAQGYPGS
jgi:hypothetical protein